MKYGLAIDPGMSTGVCLFSWSEDQAFKQERLLQFIGGAGGILAFIRKNDLYQLGDKVWIEFGSKHVELSALVVEKFTPRGGSGFALTQASAEPLRGEGVLIGRGLERFIQWQQPAAQYFMGGSDLRERKKRSREFLKLHGIYATGKTVGQLDANDAISAELHAIAFMRKMRHRPTLDELFTPEDEE